MKKTLLWMLLIAMLLSNTACGKDTGGTIDTSGENTVTETEAETVAETEPLDFLPEDLKYDGQTITFLHSQAYGELFGNEIAVNFDDIAGGDIISEAIYNRNVLVEERLGVKIASVFGSSWDTWNRDLETDIFSGDNAYQVAGGAFPTAYNCIAQGLFFNLKNVSSLNIENPWWNQNAIQSMTFGDSYFTVCGDINFIDNYASSCIYVNIDLLKQHNLETPYAAVREGTWTFDKMLGMVNDFYIDENGDGTAGMEDIYGFVSNAGMVWRGVQSTGLNFIVPDEKNTLALNQSEELFDRISVLIDLMNNTGAYSSGGDGSYIQIFDAGRALFAEDNLAHFIVARDTVDAHISVIPYPKYDESSENYCCPTSDAYTTVYGIPTSADKEMIGYVLDAMGSASVDTVTEAVIERNCMTKAVRDEDTADMIRIMLDAVAFPVETVTGWGSIYYTIVDIGMNLENDYASRAASLAESVNNTIVTDLTNIALLP